MISPAGGLPIYVATRPTDFRKGIDGLALVVQETMDLDPFSGAAFVFRSKRSDRIKVLVWDQTGIVLVHKRLEGAKFVWPAMRDGVMTMSRSAGAKPRRSGMAGPTFGLPGLQAGTSSMLISRRLAMATRWV